MTTRPATNEAVRHRRIPGARSDAAVLFDPTQYMTAAAATRTIGTSNDQSQKPIAGSRAAARGIRAGTAPRR